MASVIAIPEKNADALRVMLRQIDELGAQVRGAVNALALAYDVPFGWQLDAQRMVFVEPPKPEPQGAPEGETDHA